MACPSHGLTPDLDHSQRKIEKVFRASVVNRAAHRLEGYEFDLKHISQSLLTDGQYSSSHECGNIRCTTA